MLHCDVNIPAEDDEEIRSPFAKGISNDEIIARTWRALFTPKSPLQGDRDDHFYLEVAPWTVGSVRVPCNPNR